MNPISALKGIPSHAGCISTIALNSFTQLVRMKVFYFFGFFAVILIASNFFDLPQHEGPEAAGINILRSIKSWSLGAMTLFSIVLSIVATALLIPKDIEDRTLYTILAKPVPRIDYLAGKLLGVLLLIFVSLFLMDLLMTGILTIRTNLIMTEQVAIAEARGWSADDISQLKMDIAAQGSTWSLQGAVAAVFLRATIVASLAMLISTFSTSTLFTTIISFLVYFVGHFQADARAVYLEQDMASGGVMSKGVGLIVSIILPDFQLFNVIDSVIEGQVLPLALFGKLALITLAYFLFHLFASWFIFAEKEF